MNADNVRFIKKSPLFKKWEGVAVILIYIVLILAVVLVFTTSKAGDTVRIYSDGDLIAEVKLSQNKIIDIPEKCTVIIADGFVYVSESTCPNKLCEKCGKIQKTNQRIICVPNNVLIEIVGASSVDAVT